MFKKLFANLIAVCVLFCFIVPFCMKSSSVFALDSNAMQNYFCSIYLTDAQVELVKDIDENSVVLKVSGVEVYKDNNMLEYDKNIYFNELKYIKSSKRIDFNVKVSSDFDLDFYKRETDGDGEINDSLITSFNIILTTNYLDLILEYKNDFTEYQNTLTSNLASKNVGDSFEVPKVQSILSFTGLSYDKFTKTIHYCSNGSWQTTNSSSFTLSNAGKYRYYVTLKSSSSFDVFDNTKVLELTDKGLQEFEDGMYSMKNSSNVPLYAKMENGEYKYYTDEDFENKYAGTDAVQGDLIIPIFEFVVEEPLAPEVTRKVEYQETAVVGKSYQVSSFEIKNEQTKEFELKYSQDGETFTKAEEKLTNNYTFIPTKVGYYRLDITVKNGVGVTETCSSAIIESKELVEVEYKVSFKDWYKVNKTPFILLCISGACLVGIIALLFVKPKDSVKKVNNIKEEDK